MKANPIEVFSGVVGTGNWGVGREQLTEFSDGQVICAQILQVHIRELFDLGGTKRLGCEFGDIHLLAIHFHPVDGLDRYYSSTRVLEMNES